MRILSLKMWMRMHWLTFKPRRELTNFKEPERMTEGCETV